MLFVQQQYVLHTHSSVYGVCIGSSNPCTCSAAATINNSSSSWSILPRPNTLILSYQLPC